MPSLWRELYGMTRVNLKHMGLFRSSGSPPFEGESVNRDSRSLALEIWESGLIERG
jgi:hypothetical protein